ncbi:glycosyltransferase [Paenibacillus senegalimassiliensis]|uniref:glycosyltransferase n=1 Tax=Paenibacillus senegalimassiliensis TaxID=1737426 RepID=UPI00073E7EBF|nr:glycosyltransferase [Paenibacillus senegalimassiliensis]
MVENHHPAIKPIIEIHFNNWGGTPDRLTKRWIDGRMALFMNYALKSLRLQTVQAFQCYILYDPQTEPIIQAALQRYPVLPANIRFVTPIGYKTSLAQDLQGHRLFYRIYLSSDDLYHRNFIRALLALKPKKDTLALVPQYGYIYDSVQDRLGKFFFWLPSYGATIHSVDEFLAIKQFRYSWRDALKIPHEFIHLKEPIWINHIHAFNTGMSFDKALSWQIKGVTDASTLEPWSDSSRSFACFGPEITRPAEKKQILTQFY